MTKLCILRNHTSAGRCARQLSRSPVLGDHGIREILLRHMSQKMVSGQRDLVTATPTSVIGLPKSSFLYDRQPSHEKPCSHQVRLYFRMARKSPIEKRTEHNYTSIV